jgi:CheY-like chemotaxis protein
MYKSIWLIDDNEIDNLISKKLLERFDNTINTMEFLNARQAIEEIEKGTDLPNIILLDINMPGMNGWEFLDTLLTINVKSVHVFVYSSSIYDKDINKARSYGVVVDFVNKPLNEEKIAEIVKPKYFEA